MDSSSSILGVGEDRGKVFIGGISWETSEERLKEYFGNYGEILEAVVMRDKISGRPRGFGFLVFSDPSVLDSSLLLHTQHSIDGRTVEAKRALSREEQQVSKANSSSATPHHHNHNHNHNHNNIIRTKKIFVGGLPSTLTEQGFRHYFEAYGHVTDVVVMYDQQTNRPRGFGFISFDSEDAVDRVLHTTFHDLNGKQVEVKRALPKDYANPPPAPARSMVPSSGGSYEPRLVDSNRYTQSQNAPPYGSSGYATPAYAYGPGASNGMGFNAYGTYGSAGGNTGYGPPPAAPYGNPNVQSAGYGSGPSGAPRTSWNAQPSSGYGAGAGAYGNASWGASVASGNGGPQATAPTGQSPSGAAVYGNQGYGYGSGYGGGDGSYSNPSGYGAVGGRIEGAPNSNSSSGVGPGDMQSAGGGDGYMGSGYGGANGSSGYGNSGWRADPSKASGNYGAQGNGGYGGYGGAPARQG